MAFLHRSAAAWKMKAGLYHTAGSDSTTPKITTNSSSTRMLNRHDQSGAILMTMNNS